MSEMVEMIKDGVYWYTYEDRDDWALCEVSGGWTYIFGSDVGIKLDGTETLVPLQEQPPSMKPTTIDAALKPSP